MHRLRKLALLAAMLAAAFAVAVTTGCGSEDDSADTSGTTAAEAQIAPPENIASAGKIVFCSDTTYPPMESLDESGKAVGADVDIANAIGDLMGVDVEIKTTGFDVIIASLKGNKCDAVISALTNTPERAKEVDFADYVTVGTLMMVKSGNPGNVSDIESLSGKTVAVQAATTQEDMLKEQSQKFADEGKDGITLKTYPADTRAAAALLAGKVDAYVADATPVLYYMDQRPGQFELAGEQIDAEPEGIATRKGDPLGAAFQEAIDELYSSGEMDQILKKWGLSEFALEK